MLLTNNVKYKQKDPLSSSDYSQVSGEDNFGKHNFATAVCAIMQKKCCWFLLSGATGN